MPPDPGRPGVLIRRSVRAPFAVRASASALPCRRRAGCNGCGPPLKAWMNRQRPPQLRPARRPAKAGSMVERPKPTATRPPSGAAGVGGRRRASAGAAAGRSTTPSTSGCAARCANSSALWPTNRCPRRCAAWPPGKRRPRPARAPPAPIRLASVIRRARNGLRRTAPLAHGSLLANEEEGRCRRPRAGHRPRHSPWMPDWPSRAGLHR
jgi:hypothetical protein